MSAATFPANDRVFFVADEIGQEFCFTIADVSHESAFRRHAAQWMRLRHDPRKKSPVGKMRIVVMTREEYANK